MKDRIYKTLVDDGMRGDWRIFVERPVIYHKNGQRFLREHEQIVIAQRSFADAVSYYLSYCRTRIPDICWCD